MKVSELRVKIEKALEEIRPFLESELLNYQYTKKQWNLIMYI